MSTKNQTQWNLLLFLLHVIAGSLFTGALLVMTLITFRTGSGDIPWYTYVATIYLDLQAVRYHLATKQDRQNTINE